METTKFTYDYPRPAVTVDIVVVTTETVPRVLLIRRKHEPFAGLWAIPGGFVDMEETLEAAAKRELLEETSLPLDQLEQFRAFGDPNRDPRGRTISIVYLARIDSVPDHLQAADDAAALGWFPIDQLPNLAFDHEQILTQVRHRLESSIY